MHTRILYCCSFCGFTSLHRDDVVRHECGHWNLTRAEYETWQSLQAKAREAAARLDFLETQTSRDALNTAVKNLQIFEKEHHITQ